MSNVAAPNGLGQSRAQRQKLLGSNDIDGAHMKDGLRM